jgi:hypothetical protein
MMNQTYMGTIMDRSFQDPSIRVKSQLQQMSPQMTLQS